MEENKTFTLTTEEARTVMAVFNELKGMKYNELNKILGSITIEDMLKLNTKLVNWCNREVFGMKWDEERGWYYPDDFEF